MQIMAINSFNNNSTRSRRINNNKQNTVFQGNYEACFKEAFAKKFTNGEQAVTLMENMLRAAAKENPIINYYMHDKLLEPDWIIFRLDDCIKHGKYIQEHIQHNYENVPIVGNDLIYYSAAENIVFRQPSEMQNSIWFSPDSRNSSRLFVEQISDGGNYYDKYTFYHAKGLPLKQYTHISGSGPYSTVSETEKYNLDGSPETIGDKFKNFFGF